MAEAVADVAVSTVLETLLGPIKRHTRYAFEFRSKVDALRDETSNLKLERESLDESIEVAQGRGEVVKPRVLGWRSEADTTIADAEEVVRKGEEIAQKSCSLCLSLKARYRLGKKADQGKQGVVRLRAEKVSLGTDISYLPAPRQIVERPLEGYEAQSRNRILKEVMDALLDPNTTMVGLSGMGGIGKSTLAEEIYRQAIAKSLFYKVVIAKVTAMPEVRAIQDKIAGFIIGSKLEESSDDDVRASELNRRLNEILKDKKILIILDDIWSELDLDKVGIPTDSKGCKILMTSRRLDLLSDMGSTKNFPLQVLSKEESMSLFEKKVSVVKYRDIAQEILGRCAGFPLLIVTIAGLLKNRNEDLDAWKDVLTQLKKFENQVIQSKVYSVLELSYDRLSNEKTKLIFLLCGICCRPSFNLTDLLWYSFGLRLLKKFTILNEARRHLKTLIVELQACSILDVDEDGNIRMHDVVRDVAISIACREGLAFRNNELTEWPSRGDIIRCTNISMMSINIENLPENLGCPEVEFLLLFKTGQLNIPDSTFQGTKQLKVVHFREMTFVSMPGSLYSFENLCTLYLEYCKFPNLDAAIRQLVSLEILSFHGSDLEALPSEIGQLTRLKLLDLSGCVKLKFIPANVISKLTSLEELLMWDSFTNWEIEEHSSGSNARLSELKCLSNLASLEIFVPDVRALPESFFSMCLERYKIMIGEGARIWNYLNLGKTKSIAVDLSASIDLLEKARNLLMQAEVVYLIGINGVTNLLDSEGFSKWKKLSIRKSSTLQQIVDYRTTVTFTKLKTLGIFECHKLKSLFSISTVRSLPHLEEIKITSCNEMEALFVVDEESTQVVEFPCLRNLYLIFLPKLEFFLDVITSKSSKTASTTTKRMSLFNEKVALPSLETLYLHSIDNIEMIWSSGASGASGQLNSLTILECDKLEEIVEAGEESTNSLPFNFFPQLTSLTLWNLQELRSFYPFDHSSKWPNLVKVQIRGCSKLKPKDGLFLWLKSFGSFGEQGSPTGVGQSHITNQEKAFPNLEKMSGKFSKSILNSPSWWSHVPALKTLKVKSFRGRSMLELSEVGAFESLPNLRELVVKNSHIKQLWEYNKWSSGLDAGLPSIRILRLVRVDGLRHVGRGDSKTEEDPLLPFLESIKLWWCSDLISLAPSPSASFRNLSILNIRDCCKMTGLINPSTARTMANLVVLEIRNCGAMEEIVAAEEDDDQSPIEECVIVFNKLKSLTLANLHRLKGFCTSGCYSFNFPCLEDVTIIGCRSMRIFCNGDTIMPKLQKIKIEDGRPYWEVDINTTIKQLFKDECLNSHIRSLRLSEFPHLVERWGTEYIPPWGTEYIPPLIRLDKLVVDKCVPLLPIAVPSNVLPLLNNLHKLVVEKCESVEEIFDLHGMDQENEYYFPKSALHGVLSNLRMLTLTELPKLRNVWNEDPLGILGGFRYLSVLEVYNCRNLKHIFTLSVALGLVHLRRLQVKGCGRVEVIINQQGEDEKPTADQDDQCTTIFPLLDALELEDLPSLKEFCSGVDHVLICPYLNRITVVACPGMRVLGGSNTSSPSTECHPTNGIPHDQTPNEPALRIFNDQVKTLGLHHRMYGLTLWGSSLQSPSKKRNCGNHLNSKKNNISGLLELVVQWNISMDKAWHELIPRSFLHSLEYIKLTGFPADHELLPLDFVQAMPNLDKFLISDSFYKQIVPRVVRDAGSLENLTYLELFNLPELCNLIEEEGYQSVSVFQHLEVLDVSKCKRLTRLMTSGTARGLVNLKKIVVKDCEEMTEILSSNGEEGDEIAFDWLKSLELKGLSCLTNFSSGNDTFSFPRLEDMIIIECPGMKTFSKNDPSTPTLSEVQIAEIEDEDPWRWEGGLNSTIEKLYTEMNPSSAT